MSNLYLDSSGVATNSGSSDSNSPDLSGTADATAAANKTFVDGDVNTGTDQVALAGHGFLSGTGVELTTSGTLPAGLTLTTLYYLRAVDANTLTLHTNVADAIAGTNPVNITAAAGGGTHTINNRTINLGGSPNLSGVKVTHCRVTTTGTSHVLTMAGGVHGLANGNPVLLEVAAGGTMPGGVTAALVYWANVLSTSNTLRIYTTKALAIAGGASDVNVTSAEVRSLHVRADSQAAINVANSTVTNRKIFWIKAVDNTNKLVIIDGTLTVSGASNWAIGGQVNAAGCVDLINAVRRRGYRDVQHGYFRVHQCELPSAGRLVVDRHAARVPARESRGASSLGQHGQRHPVRCRHRSRARQHIYRRQSGAAVPGHRVGASGKLHGWLLDSHERRADHRLRCIHQDGTQWQ